jgi:hypothetical protein
MQHLSLTGLSDDGRRLVMVDDSGVEFTLDVDVHLRAALRGAATTARTGQLESKMESNLRPRDIQARIRAGESPEEVAQAARTTVEKILPYANPVLAEREHVAQRAQVSSVRRRGGLETGARTLRDAVAAQLRPMNVDPEDIEWDAWRREDGRWTLTAAYAAGARKGDARFAFDAPGNFVLTENDDARWLIGDAVAEPAPARDDLQWARERRQAPAPETAPEAPGAQLGFGDDSTTDLSDTAARVRSSASPQSADPVELSPTPEPLADNEREGQREGQRESAAASAEEAAEAVEEPARKPAKARRGRASVPSWDEIMFGGPTGSDH